MPDWETLSETERLIFARQMEVYAGFAEHVDVQIGKVCDFLEQNHLSDDTLIIYMLGDNGASAEGLMSGLYNEHTTCLLYTSWRPASSWSVYGSLPVNVPRDIISPNPCRWRSLKNC